MEEFFGTIHSGIWFWVSTAFSNKEYIFSSEISLDEYFEVTVTAFALSGNTSSIIVRTQEISLNNAFFIKTIPFQVNNHVKQIFQRIVTDKNQYIREEALKDTIFPIRA